MSGASSSRYHHLPHAVFVQPGRLGRRLPAGGWTSPAARTTRYGPPAVAARRASRGRGGRASAGTGAERRVLFGVAGAAVGHSFRAAHQQAGRWEDDGLLAGLLPPAV